MFEKSNAIELSSPFISDQVHSDGTQTFNPSKSHSTISKFMLGISTLLIFCYVILIFNSSSPQLASLNLSSESSTIFNQYNLELLSSISKVSLLSNISPNGPAIISRDNMYVAYPTSEGKIQVRTLESMSSAAAFTYSKLGGFSWYAVFSNDGENVISTTEGPAIKVWNIKAKAEVAVLKHTDRIDSIAITRDDKFIITSCHDALRVWSLQTKSVVHEFTLGDRWMGKLALSNDNKYVASSGAMGYIKVWDFNTKAEVGSIYHGTMLVHLRITNDSKHLVYTDANFIIKIKTLDTKADVLLNSHSDIITSLEISPDSRYVVTGSLDKNIRVLDIQSKTFINFNHEYAVTAVAASRDSKYVLSGDVMGYAKIWCLQTKTEIGSYLMDGEVSSIILSEDGMYIIFTTLYSSVYVWRT